MRPRAVAYDDQIAVMQLATRFSGAIPARLEHENEKPFDVIHKVWRYAPRRVKTGDEGRSRDSFLPRQSLQSCLRLAEPPGLDRLAVRFSDV
jgi:hypothetical protein